MRAESHGTCKVCSVAIRDKFFPRNYHVLHVEVSVVDIVWFLRYIRLHNAILGTCGTVKNTYFTPSCVIVAHAKHARLSHCVVWTNGGAESMKSRPSITRI